MSHPDTAAKWIVIYAGLLHVAWGLLLFASESPLGVTAIHSLPGGRWVVATVCFAVGVLALAGHLLREPWRTWAWMPQQLTLLLSAVNAIQCVVSGTFADGVVRPWAFILADQLPSILAAALHTVAVLASSVRVGAQQHAQP